MTQTEVEELSEVVQACNEGLRGLDMKCVELAIDPADMLEEMVNTQARDVADRAQEADKVLDSADEAADATHGKDQRVLESERYTHTATPTEQGRVWTTPQHLACYGVGAAGRTNHSRSG